MPRGPQRMRSIELIASTKRGVKSLFGILNEASSAKHEVKDREGRQKNWLKRKAEAEHPWKPQAPEH